MSGPEGCIIDCEGAGRGFDFHSGEPPTARLEGLTIRNGYADNGAAIKCTDGSSPTVSNCIITDNTAEGIGAGIRCDLGSSPTISGCLIAYNTAVSGGGMYTSGSGFSLVVDCVFLDNYVSGEGGALKSAGYGSPIVANCAFAGNTAGTAGGAVSCLLSDFGPHFINSTFTGNTSPGRGAAIFSTLGVQVRVDNCTFTGNDSWSEGGAIFVAANTVATIRNTIMWADAGSNGQEIALGGTYPTVDVAYSNVAGGEDGVYIHDVGTILWGDGNLNVDPLFIDADGEDDLIGTPDDNVRLAPESLCADAGDNASVPEDIADLDGDGHTAEPIPFDLDGGPRFRDNPFMPDTGNGQPPIVDMGPYEFQYDRPIPAVSEWGMVAMTLLLLIVGTLLWGRRSQVRPRTSGCQCRT
jgi:predicted outer membrane repeat protein